MGSGPATSAMLSQTHAALGNTAGACSACAAISQPAPDSDQLLGLLSNAYAAYREALADACHESMKAKVAAVTVHLHNKGVYGLASLQLLATYRRHIHWEIMGPEAFSSFYRFVYVVCKEPAKRNLQVDVAVQAWQLVLRGRFRLLDKWCAFISSHDCFIITEDTWRQVLDFSRTVHEDLGNYDPSGAWPVLLDDFVDQLRSQRRSCSRDDLLNHPQAMLEAWSGLGGGVKLAPISPHSGSKRKAPDVEEVADQLQQMPLVSAGSGGAAGGVRPEPQQQHNQQQQQASGWCDRQQHSMGGLRPTPISVKRHRSVLAGSPGARAVLLDTMPAAAGGSSSPMSLSPRAATALGAKAAGGLQQRHMLSQQPQEGQMTVDSAAVPQQLRLGLVAAPSMGPPMLQRHQQLLNNGVGGFAALHPQALLQQGSCGAGGLDARFLERTKSVNHMMQVTVNEALGLP